jgi:hypothetical protein
MKIKFKVFGKHGFYTNVALNPADPCMSYGTYRRLIRENNGLIPFIYDPSCLLLTNPYIIDAPDVYLPYVCSF